MTVAATMVRSAEAQGLDAERFVPGAGAESDFTIEHPSVPYHLGWGLGLFVNFADDPVVEVDADDEVIRRPVDTAVTADVLASLGLFGWAELGVHLPVHLVYDGDDYPTGGANLSASGGLGDLRVVPKVSALRTGDETNHVLLGFALPVSLPTGDDLALRGAGGVTLEPRVLFAVYLDRLGILASAGYRWRAEHPPTLPWGDELAFALGISYEVLPEALTLHAEMFGGKQLGTDVDGADLPLDLLAGLGYRIGAVELYGSGGLGLTDGIGDPDLRVVVGVRYRSGVPERHGMRDSDGDGVLDKDDAAPDEPEDDDGYRDEDGAPEPDNDGDGILDEEDECPELAEEAGGDRDGCPARTYVTITEGEIYIFGKVQFNTGSAEIKEQSAPLLDQVAQALEAHPQVKRVRIEGHTDNVGGKEINQRLSDDRARAVREALIARGIDGDRLEARGYGETRPLAPNKRAAGRAKNRRVEFVIVEGR